MKVGDTNINFMTNINKKFIYCALTEIVMVYKQL